MKNVVRLRRILTVAGPVVLLVVAKVMRAQPCYGWGLSLMALGQMVRLWAAGCLRKNEGLTTSGPFAHVRNPLYLGSFIIGIGQCVLVGLLPALPVVILLFGYVYLSTVLEEERSLAENLGAPYEDYCKRVPRLWPRLRPIHDDSPGFSIRYLILNREYEAVIANSVFAVLVWLIR